MSDTPRTNAKVQLMLSDLQSGSVPIVHAEVARELERELNRYKAAVEKFLALASDTCNCPGCRTAREVRTSLALQSTGAVAK